MKEHLNEDFILQVFNLALKDRKNLDLLLVHLKFEFLPEESHQRLWRVITVEYDTNDSKKPPTKAVLAQHFRTDIEVLQVLADMKDVEMDEDTVIVKNLEHFLKQNLFVSSYNAIGSHYNKGNQQLAYQEFIERADEFINFSLQNKSLNKVFGDFRKRQFQRDIDKIEGSKRVRIPTGIDALDRDIGGFETGEFVLICGDSGSGKSFLGNHFGINSARRGYPVYHAQAEGTLEQVTNRYDSAFSGSRYFDVKNNEFSKTKLASIHKALDQITGEIHIKAFEQFGTATAVEIRNDIKELQKEHDIKLVVIDYLDLIDPGDGFAYGPNMERFRQQKVARMFKNMAMELNVVVISFTQASSIPPDDLNNPDFVITRYNLAEDKGKLRPADIFLTINKTKDERKEKMCRLYLDKAREHSGGQVIYLKQNLATSRFYDKKATLKADFFDPDEE